MIQAKHLLHKTTSVLSFQTDVTQAIKLLKQEPSGFAIVAASPERYQGVLTESGLMRIYLRMQTQTEKNLLIHHRDLFEPVQLVQIDEPFGEVMRKLLISVGQRVFVIDASQKVVGYITSKDIVPYLDVGSHEDSATPLVSGFTSDLYYFESFFTKSPFLMHSVNREGKIQMANELLHDVLGYDYGSLIGKTIFDLYPSKYHREAEKGLRHLIEDDVDREIVQSEMVHKNGSLVAVELTSKTLHNQKGDSVGTMTVARPLDMRIVLPGDLSSKKRAI